MDGPAWSLCKRVIQINGLTITKLDVPVLVASIVDCDDTTSLGDPLLDFFRPRRLKKPRCGLFTMP